MTTTAKVLAELDRLTSNETPPNAVEIATWFALRLPILRAALAPPQEALTFDAFRAANVARCLKWHPLGIGSWSASDWITAIVGELGELAGLIKMRNRERDGLPGNKFSPTDKQIANEAADVVTYLDLLMAMLGIDLGRAVVEKFNEVSERVGFPDRISISAPPQEGEVEERDVMRLWREAGLPEYFLGNGGTNDKLCDFARLLRAAQSAAPPPDEARDK